MGWRSGYHQQHGMGWQLYAGAGAGCGCWVGVFPLHPEPLRLHLIATGQAVSSLSPSCALPQVTTTRKAQEVWEVPPED